MTACVKCGERDGFSQFDGKCFFCEWDEDIALTEKELE